MFREYLRRRPLQVLLIVWLAASAYSALTMYGFHQEDEVGQITAFYLHKAGVLTADELPWEHKHAVRPWVQPAVYYALFQGVIARDGYNHLFFERVSYLLSFFLVAVGALAFAWLLGERCRDRVLPHGAALGVAAACSAWFLPSFALRHSSEALSAVLLISFLWVWERGERRAGFYPALAGMVAGLTFWVRFHTGFFYLGWFVAHFWFQRRARDWRKIVKAALGFGAICGSMVLLDSWGYGRFELTPWNYFEEQVVNDVASYFGASGVEWYFVEGSLALLNPLFFLWFGIAVWRRWGDRLSRSIGCGVALFLFVHLLTPHKEMRFLAPVLPVAMLLIAWDFVSRERGVDRADWATHPLYLRLVIGLNVAAFSLFAVIGTKSARNQIEYALWRIETPATVYSATNLFQHFDRALEAPPFFEGLPEAGLLSAKFRKPPEVEYVYAPPERFNEACSLEPDGYLLVTSDQSDRGGALIEYGEIVAESEFPPGWISKLLSGTRTWRYKLVACSQLRGEGAGELKGTEPSAKGGVVTSCCEASELSVLASAGGGGRPAASHHASQQ